MCSLQKRQFPGRLLPTNGSAVSVVLAAATILQAVSIARAATPNDEPGAPACED